MKKLIKYDLNFEVTYEYLFESLDQVNTLSNEVLSLIDFKGGNFFTILPENLEKKNLYNFKYGGLKQQDKNLKN